MCTTFSVKISNFILFYVLCLLNFILFEYYEQVSLECPFPREIQGSYQHWRWHISPSLYGRFHSAFYASILSILSYVSISENSLFSSQSVCVEASSALLLRQRISRMPPSSILCHVVSDQSAVHFVKSLLFFRHHLYFVVFCKASLNSF